MSRLAEDIARLEVAARAAAIVLCPIGTMMVSIETLSALLSEMEKRSQALREYRLIDVEACWMVQAAHQLKLHREDGDTIRVERFQKLGEYLLAMIEIDLANARKSLETMR
jgi:bifunctional ADP-heptose synthase (sugar kinase/adenylyltransferase)